MSKWRFERATLATCETARGVVVVIDVLRAFSTAAYAFAAGAQSIILTGSVEDAFALRKRFPSALLMGEVGGLPIEGFDFGNSPAAIAGQNLAGVQFIQRTSAGTQGVVGSKQANLLLASSLCCAGATARLIGRVVAHSHEVTFVITGKREGGWGDEDEACADYIEALLNGSQPDVQAIIQRVRASQAGKVFLDANQPDFLEADLEHCLAVDKFDFAMCVEKQGDLLMMKKGCPSPSQAALRFKPPG